MPKAKKPSTTSSARRKQRKAAALAKRPRGRPTGTGFKPTVEQRSIVQLGATYRIPEDEIVQAIINPTSGKPISPVTLRKHFPEELKQGYVQGKMRLMAATFQSATGIKDTDGKFTLAPNVTAQIWLGKVLYGMRESVAVEVPPASAVPEGAEENVTLEASRRVAFLLHAGARMVDKKAGHEKPKKA